MKNKIIFPIITLFCLCSSPGALGMDEKKGGIGTFLFGGTQGGASFRGLRLGELRARALWTKSSSRLLFMFRYPWISTLVDSTLMAEKKTPHMPSAFQQYCFNHIIRPGKNSLDFWVEVEKNKNRINGDETIVSIRELGSILKHFTKNCECSLQKFLKKTDFLKWENPVEEEITIKQCFKIFGECCQFPIQKEDLLGCLFKNVIPGFQEPLRKLENFGGPFFRDTEILQLGDDEEDPRDHYQDIEITTVSERRK